MSAKALKQPSTARMAQFKQQLQELIDLFEFETGERVNSIELQGGARTSTLTGSHDLDVYLEDDAAPAAWIGFDLANPGADDQVIITNRGIELLTTEKGAGHE